jgi:hypothetical protein
LFVGKKDVSNLGHASRDLSYIAIIAVVVPGAVVEAMTNVNFEKFVA